MLDPGLVLVITEPTTVPLLAQTLPTSVPTFKITKSLDPGLASALAVPVFNKKDTFSPALTL